MKKLNLTNLEKSDVKYKITSYPDGQQDIIITHFLMYNMPNSYKIEDAIAQPVQIESRFNSFRDLELIICTVKALRRLKVKEIHLYIPYLLGSRSDRQFQNGGTSYLVDVVAPIINSLNFESVTVLDVHNPVMTAACINNLKLISNIYFVKECLARKYDYDSNTGDNKCVLISPDAGAFKKIFDIAKEIEFKGQIITASKNREISTGKILSTEVPMNPIDYYKDKDYIIIDDICDGGRTFIELAKVLKDLIGRKATINLIVTHGIFSAGLKELSEYFDHIYTTNSIMEINSSTEFGMRNERYLNKVTQLNIF